MSDKIILGFTGEIAAGKTTAGDYLAEKYQAEGLQFSQVLRKILDELYLPQTRQNMQEISTILRKQFGEDLIAKVMVENIKATKAEIVTIDGIRRHTDIANIEQLPNFNLIYVTASPKTRYDRLTARGQNSGDKQKTFEEFKADENRESEQQIREVGLIAKHKIDNESSLEDFYKQLEDIITKIKSEK